LDEWRALPEDKEATIRKTRADRKKKSGGKKTPKGGPKTIRKFGSVQKLKAVPRKAGHKGGASKT